MRRGRGLEMVDLVLVSMQMGRVSPYNTFRHAHHQSFRTSQRPTPGLRFQLRFHLLRLHFCLLPRLVNPQARECYSFSTPQFFTNCLHHYQLRSLCPPFSCSGCLRLRSITILDLWSGRVSLRCWRSWPMRWGLLAWSHLSPLSLLPRLL